MKKLNPKEAATDAGCRKFQIKINGPKKIVEFTCLVHHSANQSQLRLDPKEFYARWSAAKKAPACPDYELELTGLEKWSPAEKEKVHLHESKDGKWFVCYTKRIPTLKAAENVFKMWAAGAIYTMWTGEDFGHPFNRFNENFADFLKFMSQEHNIDIREFKSEMPA